MTKFTRTLFKFTCLNTIKDLHLALTSGFFNIFFWYQETWGKVGGIFSSGFNRSPNPEESTDNHGALEGVLTTSAGEFDDWFRANTTLDTNKYVLCSWTHVSSGGSVIWCVLGVPTGVLAGMAKCSPLFSVLEIQKLYSCQLYGHSTYGVFRK